MRLTEHFTLEALCASSTAERLGISNTPPDELVLNAQRLAQGCELIRTALGGELHIDSGYRSPELNEKIGGAKTSQHTQFLALDFKCPSFGTPEQIVEKLAALDEVPFDQLIQEGSWVHVSFSEKPRREVLTAIFVNGKATYAKREG